MGRQSAFSVKIDMDQVTRLATKFAGLTPEKFSQFVIPAINETTDQAYALGRKTMLRGINLTDAYVQRKMKVEHATAQRPVATITAFGGKGYITSLSHYGAMQKDVDVNWSNDDILSMGKKFGPWRGWTKRTGNAAVGIAVNKKAAGRSVEVVRGRRKLIKPAFAIPGKKDNDGNLIVFTRTPAGGLKALTGPSVYQLFRVAAGQIKDDVSNDLATSVINAAERRLREELR